MAIIGTGGGNASFSQLENHIAAGGSITTGWNASTQVLTISASGFTSSNIAGAGDVTITSVTNNQILVRSGNAWINATVSGDATISANGNLTINQISGSKMVANTVTARELNVSGNGTAGQLLASDGDGSFRWEDAGGGDTVFSRSDISAGNNISITNSGTDGIVINAENIVTAIGELTDVTLNAPTSGQLLVRSGLSFVNASITGGTNVTVTESAGSITISATGGETLTFSDTTEVDFTKSGTTVSAEIKSGSVTITKLNPGTNNSGKVIKVNSAGNAFEFADDNTGGGGGTNITVSDTPTIDLNLSNGTLSATVRANSISGNQISANIGDLNNVDTGNTNSAGQLLILDTSVTPDTFYNYAMSGDVSMTYSGVVTIGSKRVTTSKMHGGTNSSRLLGTGSATDGTINAITLSPGDNISVNHSNNVITISGQASGGSSFERSDIHAGNNISLTNSGTEGVIVSASISSIALGDVTHSASQSGKFVAVSGSGTSDLTLVDAPTSVSALNDLSDVSASSFANGDFLIGSGSTLVKGNITGSGGISVTKNAGGIVITGTSSASNGFEFDTKQSFTSGSTGLPAFTGIDSNAKRVTIELNELNNNQSANTLILQLGDSGGYETNDYKGRSQSGGGGSVSANNGLGLITQASPELPINGTIVLVRDEEDGNTWIITGSISSGNNVYSIAGSKTLSGTLDRIRFITSGSMVFTGGFAQIIVEDGSAGGGGSSGATTLSALTDTSISSPSNNQVLTWNGSNWVNANASGGGSSDPGITTVINFGNDTTTAIAVGDFVASLDGIGNNAIAGEKATSASKVPIGIAVKAIAAKANSGANEVVVSGSVMVMGAYNPPAGDIDGNFSGATDRQAVYLKFVSNAWKFTLETTAYRVATHHNGSLMCDFTGMENINDIADDIADVVPDILWRIK